MIAMMRQAFEVKQAPRPTNTSIAFPVSSRRDSVLVKGWTDCISLVEKTASQTAEESISSVLARVEQLEAAAEEQCLSSLELTTLKHAKIGGLLYRLAQLEGLFNIRAHRRGDSTVLERICRIEHTVNGQSSEAPLAAKHVPSEVVGGAPKLTAAEWKAMQQSMTNMQQADRELDAWMIAHNESPPGAASVFLQQSKHSQAQRIIIFEAANQQP
jgi:hypothetical protein